MDKNKSRTDLLAAGRKKLQQFRQKKEVKSSASHGKSSKKYGKAEQADADASSTTLIPTVPPEVTEKETPRADSITEISDSPVSHSMGAGEPDMSSTQLREDQVTDIGAMQEADGLDSTQSDRSREIELEGDQQLPFSELGERAEALSTIVSLKTNMDEVSLEPEQTGESGDVSAYDGATLSDGFSASVLNLYEVDGISSANLAMKNQKSEQIVPGSYYEENSVMPFPSGDDGRSKEEKSCAVLDNRTAAEGYNQQYMSDESFVPEGKSETELKVDEQIPLSEPAVNAEALPRIDSVNNIVEEASHEPEQTSESGEVSASDVVTLSDGFSASVLALNMADGISTGNPAMQNQQREQILSGSSCEENLVMLFQSDGLGKGREENTHYVSENRTDTDGYNRQYMSEESFIAGAKSPERPLEAKCSAEVQTVSPVADVSSISLMQLTEVIRGLNEEEFRFLLDSRESVSNAGLGTGGGAFAKHGFTELLQRLNEELILTHFTKDIFHLQLAEHSELEMELEHQHHQLVDEISVLNDSLKEAHERNQFLAEEHVQCRSELQTVTSRREELEDQFRTAKAEVEEFSSRARELQSRLERSERDLFSLSTELDGFKILIADLQVENKKLDGTIASMTEERQKLVEERVLLLNENENLSKELADGKSLVAALQVENSNLSGSLSSVTEERTKLEEEKGHLFHANAKLSLELADCKGLVAALQVENTSLNGSLALVTEQRSRLEEDQEHLNLESERLTSKLFVLQDQFSTEHAERMKVESSLKEMTMRLEQLTEENILLQSSLEVFKAKVREIDGQQSPILCQAGEAGNEVSQEVRSRGHESVTDYEDSHQTTGKQDGEVYSPVLEKPLSDGPAVEPPIPLPEQEVFDDSYVFVALKGHLEGAEKILQKLEKAIEGAHFNSTSFSRKVAAPGISKLIQAFESKVHVDEQEEEERDPTENQSPADPFMVAKELAGNLRALIKQLEMDAENASVLFTGERDGRKIADATFMELTAEHEALKEHSNYLEAANIELEVLFEALKQHVCEVEAKDGELEVLFKSLKLQGINLKAENRELGEKLCGYQSRISDLQSCLDGLQHGSNEMASSISNQLENMQKEMAERVLLLEDWNSTVAEILEVVGKLDESVGEVLTSTISIGTQDGLNVSSRVAASVSAATKVIEALQGKLQAAQTDHEEICTLHKHVNEKFDDLHGKNELAISILHKMHGRLRQLVISSCGSVDESEKNIQIEKLLDPLDYSEYEMLLEQLDDFLEEKLQLRTVNNKLTAELIRREREFEEMSRRCLDAYTVHKLVDDVESVLKLGEDEINLDKTHASHLESVVSLLVQKFKELDAQVGLSREEFGSKMNELTELQDKIHQLESLCFEHENEIFILKDSLHLAEETLIAAHSELQEKRSELEQTEQRVSSVREKLGIAVAKGKGLIVQRDGLKQSLADTSSQLERSLHELQLKDSRIQEVETKLKTYSEAGERVEALESELSYIRNSATALRESFLHKDSVLQRIEEILEDLDLPEHFHSRDIIEKIDWLARSTTGNSVPLTDWDQKSSAGGGSYSDAAFAALDAWKHDVQPSSNSEDDMRRKFEELQNRLYGLAEQNEMLEQSLMERNNLVQRLEELLDRIDMPSQFRSVEPEDRIEWLGKALSEAQHDRNSLLQKTDNFENYCGSLSADLEESQRRVSELEADLQAVSREREDLSERLEILTHEHEKLSARMVEFKLEKEKLQSEVTGLSEKLVERLGNEEKIVIIEGKIKRLQDLASDALQESGTMDLVSGSDSIHCLEELLRKLIENYAILSSKNPVIGDAADRHDAENVDAIAEVRSIDTLDSREQDMALLKTELEEAMRELMQVREERDRYLEKQQSLYCEVEALSIKREELEKILSQEEQKSASVREKFNVAVRKGKSLLQQRDGLKQIIDEKNAEVENLKSEITYRENALAEYEQKFKKLSAYPERVEALESECLLLRNRLTETEHYLQEKGRILSMALNALNNIGVDGEFNSGDPIERLEQLGKLFYDLRTAVASSEQEMRKSKKAAELLLAELNEVQERNDVLQEELATAANEIVELTKERDLAEAAKLEANSRLESLSTVRSEERKNQLSEFKGIKSGLNQLRKGFYDVNNLLADVFSKDLEFLHNLEAGIDSCLKTKNVEQVIVPFFCGSDGFITGDSDSKEMDSWSDSKTHGQLDEDVFGIYNFVMHHLHEFVTEIGDLEEKLRKHSVSLHKQNSSLSNLVAAVHGEMTSQKESVESMKRDIIRIESVKSEKDMELNILQRNIAVLYEACASSVMEVENHRLGLVGNNMTVGEVGLNLKSTAFADGGQAHFSSEESIRNMADRLVLAVRNFASLKTETIVGNGKEMKITIANLQKELHEKDIQNERICSELVSQIKEAEAATRSYSLDLQSSQTRVHDLEEQVEAIERERNLLKQRVKELQDAQVASTELEDRIRSYTDVLAAKDQEIEALMQALDEEEAQMETLKNKIEELEKVVQQKNLDVKNLEGSRGKALKKLSITVTKFDELHQFSESLLAEVEKLQAQLQDRDAEISFLRQEVTRCTNDVLVASQMSSKRTSDEIHEFLAWFDSMIARFGVHDVHLDDKNDHDIHEHKEILQKKITSIVSEWEDLWVVAQSKDALLEVERSKVEELTRKEEFLEKSLREKDSRLNLLEGVRDSERATSMTSEILEVEPVVNKRTVAGTSIASQVRSLRKGNNDQGAIAIDMDPGSSGRLEDEDDDKVHGFKSLVTSRIVPRFTRPVTDMIDGLWVSCDRALMRQPALRLGIIIYWAILHALLATLVV